jgi:hypothetical protein
MVKNICHIADPLAEDFEANPLYRLHPSCSEDNNSSGSNAYSSPLNSPLTTIFSDHLMLLPRIRPAFTSAGPAKLSITYVIDPVGSKDFYALPTLLGIMHYILSPAPSARPITPTPS